MTRRNPTEHLAAVLVDIAYAETVREDDARRRAARLMMVERIARQACQQGLQPNDLQAGDAGDALHAIAGIVKKQPVDPNAALLAVSREWRHVINAAKRQLGER